MVDLSKLKEEQIKLAKKVITTNDFEKIKTIAGCDQVYINNKEIYAIPLTYTESVISFDKSDLHQVAGSGLVADYNGRTISVIPLHELFKTNLSYNQLQTNGDSRLQSLNNKQKYNVIVVLSNNRYIGFVVDKLLQQKEIVEKPLKKPVDKTAFFSGVTIMGDGRVCLVLDVNEIGRYLLTAKNKMAATAA
ncbi:MAG: chemotaxis protein CheW [Bacteroidetes bacterium]|nr:chemotaxis protein CheW [Bacteroidota bacterium]